MQRVAILVNGWNLLKAADHIKRRVNLAELVHAALAHCPDRYIAFQRFYIGSNSGFDAAQRVERLAKEARRLGYEWVQCSTLDRGRVPQNRRRCPHHHGHSHLVVLPRAGNISHDTHRTKHPDRDVRKTRRLAPMPEPIVRR